MRYGFGFSLPVSHPSVYFSHPGPCPSILNVHLLCLRSHWDVTCRFSVCNTNCIFEVYLDLSSSPATPTYTALGQTKYVSLPPSQDFLALGLSAFSQASLWSWNLSRNNQIDALTLRSLCCFLWTFWVLPSLFLQWFSSDVLRGCFLPFFDPFPNATLSLTCRPGSWTMLLGGSYLTLVHSSSSEHLWLICFSG